MQLALLPTLLLAPLLPVGPGQEAPAAPARASDSGVTAAELEARVRALTAPALEGRAVGTDGIGRAASWLAGELAALGLEPAGDAGTFFQDVPLVRYRYPELPKLTLRAKDGSSVEGVYGVDFDLELRGSGKSTAVLPIRQVQFEGQMPKALDPNIAINVNGTKPQREAWIEAAGLVNFEGWGLEVVTSIDQSTWRLGAEGPPPGERLERPLVGPDPCEVVTLRATLRQFYLGAMPNTVSAQLEITEETERVVERNIVARLKGVGTPAHPELAGEVVVLSAHYDGPGRTSERQGGKLRPAADANASGCAALLELAQAMAAGPAPARTVLFVFLTGEEWKSLGRERYLAGPPAPLERTALFLGVNMIGRPDPERASGELWLSGYGRTDLGELAVAGDLGITPDTRRRQHYYNRFFDRALGVEGVRAHTISSYGGHGDLNRVTDTADALDYAHMESAVRRIGQLVGPVVRGEVNVGWREGKQPRALDELLSQGSGEADGDQDEDD